MEGTPNQPAASEAKLVGESHDPAITTDTKPVDAVTLADNEEKQSDSKDEDKKDAQPENASMGNYFVSTNHRTRPRGWLLTYTSSGSFPMPADKNFSS